MSSRDSRKWIPKVGDLVVVRGEWVGNQALTYSEKACVVTQATIAKDGREKHQGSIFIDRAHYRVTRSAGRILTKQILIPRNRDLEDWRKTFAIEFEPGKWCYFHHFVQMYDCDPSKVKKDNTFGWFEFPRKA